MKLTEMQRWSQTDYRNLLSTWPSTDTMEEAERLVYQWVLQKKISPKQMTELLVAAYKEFVY